MKDLLTEQQIKFLCLPIIQSLTYTMGAVDAGIIVDKVNMTFLNEKDRQYAFDYILNTLLEQKT